MGKRGFKVPFDKDGNMLHYVKNSTKIVDGKLKLVGKECEWRDPFTFSDKLVLHSYKANSGLVLLRSTTDKLYPMKIIDFLKIVRHQKIDCGQIGGTFKAVKQGSYYSIVLDNAITV